MPFESETDPEIAGSAGSICLLEHLGKKPDGLYPPFITLSILHLGQEQFFRSFSLKAVF